MAFVPEASRRGRRRSVECSSSRDISREDLVGSMSRLVANDNNNLGAQEEDSKLINDRPEAAQDQGFYSRIKKVYRFASLHFISHSIINHKGSSLKFRIIQILSCRIVPKRLKAFTPKMPLGFLLRSAQYHWGRYSEDSVQKVGTGLVDHI